MPYKRFFLIPSFFVFFLCFIFSCTQSLEEKQLERMMLPFNQGPGASYYQNASGGFKSIEQSAGPPSVTLPGSSNNSSSEAPVSIVGGVPLQAEKGFCGDGIINGYEEQCDKKALLQTSCRDLPGGMHGDIKCGDKCQLDISDCITTATDAKLGKKGETCRCNCDPSLCQGSCASIADSSSSRCFYDCRRRNCTCQCEGMFDLTFHGGQVQCTCVTDIIGKPDCVCSLDQIEVFAVTKPNFSQVLSGY